MPHLHVEELRVHRPWEDWLGMALGSLTVFSPWAVGADDLLVAMNALVVGVLIYAVSAFELRVAEVWEDWLNLLLGLWLLCAPWTMGYEHQAAVATAHHTLGALVAALASLELWQDMRPVQPVRRRQ